MPRSTRYYHHHDDEPAGGYLPVEIDPAQESLGQALRAGFNVLRVILVLLLVAYFSSGIFQVNPGQQGLIVRFGRLLTSEATGTPVFGEGWHAAWPDPIDQKIRISGQPEKTRLYTFCFPIEEKNRKAELSELNLGEMVPFIDSLKPDVHGTILSGDRNLSHGLFAIEYKITDAAAFVQNIGDDVRKIEPILQRLAENTIVHTAAGIPVERIIRTQTDETGGDFTAPIKRRLQEELDRLKTGVTLNAVEAKTIEPGKVREAFLDVIKAKSDLQTDKDAAQQEVNRILSESAGPDYSKVLDAIEQYGAAQTAGADAPRLHELRQSIDETLGQAEGKVAARLRQAGSRANEIREGVRREYEMFANYRDLYRRYPELTAVRLWVRMREAILESDQNEIFFVPNAGEIEIITDRDPQRVIDADFKKFGKGSQAGGQ